MQQSEIMPGLVLVTETLPFVRSVSIGFWIRAGVLYEPVRLQGVSHFLEHLLFKGTARRSARDISESFDNIGGEINAYTAKEYTCLYAKIVDEHLEAAVDILCDMIVSSRLDQADVIKEQNVVLEEISMYEDTPDEYVHDVLAQTIWPASPLGRSILGTRESIAQLSAADIRSYYQERYTGANMVIAAAGSVDHAELADLLAQRLQMPADQAESATKSKPEFTPAYRLLEKPTEQLHLALGFPGLPIGDERRHTWSLLSNILGAGMSSRLFQRLREDHGLVYNAYSYTASFGGAGYSAIYLGLSPQNVEKALQLIAEELADLRSQPISEAELRRAKEQAKGALIMGMESTANNMSRLGRGLLLNGRVRTVAETVERIEAVTSDQLQRLAAELYARRSMAAAAVGSVDGLTNLLETLAW